MLPETRKKLPNETFKKLTASEYAVAIESALKRELGSSRHAVKTLSRLTSASERTVQNWLAGIRGPNGVHLIILAQHYYSVRTTIMLLAGQGTNDPRDDEVVLRLLFDAIELLMKGQ